MIMYDYVCMYVCMIMYVCTYVRTYVCTCVGKMATSTNSPEKFNYTCLYQRGSVLRMDLSSCSLDIITICIGVLPEGFA